MQVCSEFVSQESFLIYIRKDTRREKTLILDTYKFHALGDYPDTVTRFGTTDSYTSEIVRSFLVPQTLAKV
jgi:hypothetical protein